MNSSDIHAKKFKTKMNGYNPVEVDEYMETIARSLDLLEDDINDLRTKNAAQAEQLAEYRGMERALRESIVSAQKTSITVVDDARDNAREMTESAQTQATRTIDDATAAAERMILAAQEETRGIYEGERSLRMLMDDYRRQIRTVMSTQLAAMEDIFSYQNEEASVEECAEDCVVEASEQVGAEDATA